MNALARLQLASVYCWHYGCAFVWFGDDRYICRRCGSTKAAR